MAKIITWYDEIIKYISMKSEIKMHSSGSETNENQVFAKNTYIRMWISLVLSTIFGGKCLLECLTSYVAMSKTEEIRYENRALRV